MVLSQHPSLLICSCCFNLNWFWIVTILELSEFVYVIRDLEITHNYAKENMAFGFDYGLVSIKKELLGSQYR